MMPETGGRFKGAANKRLMDRINRMNKINVLRRKILGTQEPINPVNLVNPVK
jgi:hypothetical protein